MTTKAVSMFIKNLLDVGTADTSLDEKRKHVIVVNTLALLTGTLVFILGGVFYFLVPSLFILVPLLIEGTGMYLLIVFNAYKRHDAANLGMFIIHYIAALYWTIVLGKAIPYEVVIAFLLVFLVCRAFLIYKNTLVMQICFALVLLLFITLQLNSYFKIVHPMDIDDRSAFIMRICTSSGMLAFIIYVILSVRTELTTLITQLQAANRRMSATTSFLKETFHEIRTPLNGVIGGVQLVQFTKEKFQGNEFVTAINPELTRMYDAALLTRNIINNVLDFTKISAGKFNEVRYERVDIRQLLEMCVSINRYIATHRLITIDYDISLTVPSFFSTDKLILTKVLNNLISNAAKFGDRNSNMQLKLWVSEESVLRCKIISKGEIPPERLKKLFEQFESARNNFTDGTGIGLVITKQMLNLLNGDVIAYNVGGNAVFEFWLHFKEDTIVPFEALIQSDDVSDLLKGYKVLIVDDDDISLNLLGRFLEAAGATTAKCTNGIEALSILRECRPHLIVTDTYMPRMDGKSLIQKLRLQPDYNSIPIIAITGNAFLVDGQTEYDSLRNAGANTCMIKPVILSEFLQTVQQQLVIRYESIM
ncbi:MAG TPA: response regulator [Chitinophaga sp.]|uniref:response regulator n=1 Tax=Chitinophaga sp. TaxID=1869181 RepID=UPI002CB9F4C8|nr:response regulator [Chitinophaga sp.]HVI48244.1 response regulator [Chitinophaga sp.]